MTAPLGVVALAALAAGCASAPRPAASVPPETPALVSADPIAIAGVIDGVVDRQLARPLGDRAGDAAAFHAALLAIADVRDDARLLAAARAAGEAQAWRPGPALEYAPLYLALYAQDRDRRVLGPTVAALDQVCPRRAGTNDGADVSDIVASLRRIEVLARLARVTGRTKYLGCVEPELRAIAGDDPLIARSPLPVGELIARLPWPARGRLRAGARVLASLIGLFDVLPDDHPARKFAALLFGHLAEPLLSAQQADGTWHEPGAATPDLAATATIAYAMAAAPNRGYKGYPFAPWARRAWLAVARAPDQAGPDVLRAGAELYRLALLEGSRAVTAVATNPLAEPRFGETIELPWAPLARALGAVPGDPIVAVDARSGRLFTSQLYDENGDALAEKLLVSASLLGNEARRIVVHRLARPYRAPVRAVRTYGRFVPEARDDFAWENDRVAFRVYGPGIEAQHLSSGIDVWAKRVREPVIDRWYQRDDYHRDRGEGLDFYRVGPSRGCGGLGLWDDNQLYTSRNFRRWRLLANGPVRVAFELDYEPWGPSQTRVSETKRISLDLGQNLSRVEVRFGAAGPPRSLPVAVGVVRRGEGTVARDEPTSWLSYVEPPQGDSGQIGCGVLAAENAAFVENPQHYLLVRDHPSQRPFVYYAGAYWSKAPDFRQPDEWSVYLAAFSRRAGAPIAVTIAPDPSPAANM